MLYKETMTAKVLIKFMSRLLKDSQRNVFLILNNSRVFHSKIAGKQVKSNKDKIEV